eukprot:1870164-Rhodomonas_salina.5
MQHAACAVLSPEPRPDASLPRAGDVQHLPLQRRKQRQSDPGMLAYEMPGILAPRCPVPLVRLLRDVRY